MLFRSFDRLRVAEVPVIEAHPVSVIEDRSAFERGLKQLRAIEVEGVGLDSISKEMETVRRIGERANPVAGSYQSRGNVTARIAKGACDDVQLIRCQGITLSDRREPEAVFSQRRQPTARRIPVVDGYHCGSPDSFVHAIEL